MSEPKLFKVGFVFKYINTLNQTHEGTRFFEIWTTTKENAVFKATPLFALDEPTAHEVEVSCE